MKLTILENINSDFDFSELDKAVEKLSDGESKYFNIDYCDEYNDRSISVTGNKIGRSDKIRYLLTIDRIQTQTFFNLNTLKYKIKKYLELNGENIHDPIELANVFYD